MVVHVFNPSTWEAEAGRFFEFEASLVYKVSSRTAIATQRNPVSKTNKQTKKQNKTNNNNNNNKKTQCLPINPQSNVNIG